MAMQTQHASGNISMFECFEIYKECLTFFSFSVNLGSWLHRMDQVFVRFR